MEAYPISHPTVLLIDDDQIDCSLVRWHLEQGGFQVVCAPNGKQGLREFFHHQPDLILLDINMPAMDGYTVCQRIREVSNVPIIILSSRIESESVIRGLTLGADDYVIKPYDRDVLIARARASLRRAAAEPTAAARLSKLIYTDDYLTINLQERRVLVNGQLMRMSPTEYNVLEVLLESSPRVVPYRILLENVWGFEYVDDIDYLRVYIWHVRRKLEPDPKKPVYIINEPGIGYRFRPQN